MTKFGLIGYPLGHSISPFIHENLFKLRNYEGEYQLYEIEDKTFKDDVSNIFKMLSGFNVTIPYKTEIISNLDGLDEKAVLFGAVNTVSVKENKTCGYNTDCIGFLRGLKSAGIDLQGRVLLCGSGGVARMIAFECCLADCSLTIAVRPSDIPFANQIKKEIKEKLNKNIDVILLSEVNKNYDLVINATPVGMYPNTEACVLKKSQIERCGAAFDVIYNPQQTLFMRYATECGIKNSNGLEMLIWQAAAAQEIWLNCSFEQKNIDFIKGKIQKELDF